MHFFLSISSLCFMLMGNPFWFSLISLVIKLMAEVINFAPKLPYRLLRMVMKSVWIHLWKVKKAPRMKRNLKMKFIEIMRHRARFCRVMGCWYPLKLEPRENRKERMETFFTCRLSGIEKEHVCAATNTTRPGVILRTKRGGSGWLSV